MIEVQLLSHSPQPVRSLYLAYRTAYSAVTPIELNKRIDAERITHDQMLAFINERLETGHASPLEQVQFEYLISGVTRAFSHQFVRHHIGISFEQQSQRYVTFKDGSFPFTVPSTVAEASEQGKDGLSTFYSAMDSAKRAYSALVDMGIPAEDARFVLPNAANTNFKVMVNFLELLHIGDIRLCTRAQWEFRKVVAMMRAELKRELPEFAKFMQPKCGDKRMGYCDESYESWAACPLGKIRPHKKDLFEMWALSKAGPSSAFKEPRTALNDDDFKVIESV